MNRLPEAWISPPPTRELRELVRYRAKLVALRSGLKAQVHAVLAKAGVLIAVSDHFGVAGRERLTKVALGPAYAQRVLSLLELIDVLDAHSMRFTVMIAEQLRGHPGYRAIQEVPGIGPTLGAVFVAEIGNMHRFADPARLCSWAGLTHGTTSLTLWCGAGTSPNREVSWCAGRRSRLSSISRSARRSPSTGRESKPAAARTSPRSPRPENCSHWSATGCATGTSAH